MSIDLPTVYLDQMVRAAIGTRPAMLAKTADTATLRRMAQTLAENEAAVELLRAKGYGKRGMSILDMVRALPDAGKP